nr:hypothetical protein [Tanacetum cinerariifolium]
ARIAQSSALPPVADEPASPMRDDRANIAKTSTLPHESTSRVTSLAADEGIPTASTTISTATSIFATATIVTLYTRRKGKEKIVETHTPKKNKRLQEQIDIQFARELEEELEREAQRMNA